MDIHQNARLTPQGRETLAKKVLLEKMTLKAAAAAFNVSPKTAGKWVHRYRQQGAPGMRDRSSRPHRCPRRTSPDKLGQMEALRRQRWCGWRIAHALAVSPSTVSRALRRLHLSRLRDLQPALPIQRYEHPAPGDLLHLDIKQLGRFRTPGFRPDGRRRGRSPGAGWIYLHVAIDDHSRLAFCQLLPDQTAASSIAFLRAALAYYAQLGIHVRRLLTDNGHCYRSHAFAAACRALTLRHAFTRPYTPRTNGKAERFIQTALREWAYARLYAHSDLRDRELPAWLHDYNWHRPHGSLDHAPPISRCRLDRNNLLTHHS